VAGVSPAGTGIATATATSHRAHPGNATVGGSDVRSPHRRRRSIMLTTVVLAGAAVAAVLTAHDLTGTKAPALSQGSVANAPLFGQIAVFTPPRAPGHWQEATSVAFRPDGRTLAVGLTTGVGNVTNARTFGGQTYLFNLATGRQSADLGVGGSTAAFSPSGNLLAASGGAGQHLVYLARAGASTAMDATAAVLPGTGSMPIESLAFSRDGRMLAARDYHGDIYLWSTAAKRLIPTKVAEQSAYTALALSPGGKTIATAQLGDIYLWNVASGRLTGLLPLSQNAIVLSMAYSPDGRLIAIPLNGGGVGLWDVATRKRVGTLPEPGAQGVEAVAFSPDGQMLAAGDGNGKTYLWDLRTGKLIATLVNPLGPVPLVLAGQTMYDVRSVAFSPNGRMLATSDTDGRAYLWRVR
jgi:WD40 repeat protein